MMKIRPLSPKLLCTKCSPKQLNFATTAELAELSEPVGQERAMAAIEFGVNIQQDGYNLYLLGPKGTGKYNLIHSVLKQQAKSQPTAADWCYVNNFENSQKPVALQLPPGMGPVLQKDMADLIEALRIDQHEFYSAVAHLMTELKNKYQAQSAVIKYLSAVETDIIENARDFFPSDKQPDALTFIRYQVNVLVSHHPEEGAPVIYEDHPTHANLLGCAEYLSQLGMLITNFSLIRPGALHRANGGYLILDAHQLMNQLYSWDSLKRALYAKEITFETLEQVTGFPKTISLEPQPIPLHVKIILLGERPLYYQLCEQDMHFPDLFKVAADFSNHIPRTPENFAVFAQLVATITKKENLLPLNRHAVAKMIDHSTRLANDTQRLFTHMRCLVDLLREANYWARRDQRHVIKAYDIQKAIDQQIYRANRIETRIHDDFKRNILLIDTQGKKIGQVNGLSVLQIGHYSFGSPSRITSTVRLGKGEVIDIEREVELGGSLHSKGVFILSGFLSGRYLVEHHLSITATLVFEQNYGEVEGDSASAAELAALLSAIARLPLKQSFAITGSVNQYGQIQPIGNLNEKIEGFFSICQIKGFTRHQGVIIPAGNVQHLMLRDEIVEAAKKKSFFIYAVETIDQVMTILTGMRAGKPNKKGHFPANTVNGLIEKHLRRYAERADGDHKNDSDSEV